MPSQSRSLPPGSAAVPDPLSLLRTDSIMIGRMP